MFAKGEPEWDPFADPALEILSNPAECAQGIPLCITSPSNFQQSAEAVDLCVSSLTGDVYNIAVDRSWSVTDLKMEIQSRTGIPFREQGLVGDSSLLSDETLLSALPLETLTNLSLVRTHDPWLASLMDDGWLLRVAPDDCKEDASYVTAAVRQNGLALQYAGETLRADMKIVPGFLVTLAVKQQWLALQHASETLKAHQVTLAVKQNGLALQHASDSLKANRELVLCAVKRHALLFANSIFQDDVEVVQAAVTRSGTALQFATDRLRADVGTVLIAVKQNPQAALMTTRALWDHPEFLKAVQGDPNIRSVLRVAMLSS